MLQMELFHWCRSWSGPAVEQSPQVTPDEHSEKETSAVLSPLVWGLLLLQHNLASPD